jgi:hypothetical protein
LVWIPAIEQEPPTGVFFGLRQGRLWIAAVNDKGFRPKTEQSYGGGCQ